MPTPQDPALLIERLGLMPHPEGGWYRQTWHSTVTDGDRPATTAIHFLLEAHQRSHWHRVRDAEEIWLWHAGSPLLLAQAAMSSGPVSEAVLGPDILAGQSPQLRIPLGYWQAATPIAGEEPGWTLVSCVVSPGFQFSGFELAPPDWFPGCEASLSEA